MVEAKEGCALLEDIDEQTFVRFSQYAYTGDYVAADPDILLDSSTIVTAHFASNDAPSDQVEGDVEEATIPAPPVVYLEREPASEPVAVDHDWWSAMNSKKDKKKKKVRHVEEWRVEEAVNPDAFALQSKKFKLWNDFKSKAYAISEPAFQPRKNRESCEDYTEVFLSHARLYVFADKYDIAPLRDLSLHRLQQTLAMFTPYASRVGDIVDLLRYSYLNTADASGLIDDLRSLVVHYAACMVEDLARSVNFRSLLEEAGSFSGDLFDQMLKRLD